MNALTLFTERFNELLSDKGIKPSNLAALLNVPKNTVCRYARGVQMPDLKMAMLLSDFFGCSVDYLLGRTDEGKTFTPAPAKNFRDRFPYLMKKFATNKYRIAKATELHQSILYRWQRGDCAPELASLLILADHFGCSIEYLLGRCETIC